MISLLFFWSEAFVQHPWRIAVMVVFMLSWRVDTSLSRRARLWLSVCSLPWLLFLLTESTTPSSTDIRVDLVLILPLCLASAISWIVTLIRAKRRGN